MKDHALLKRSRRGPVHSQAAQATDHRVQTREIRSYESEYVHALSHLDFHHGSVRVLLEKGQWVYPLLLGIMDDCSRLCCHAQWYLTEAAEELCHGLSQAFQKRSLPRALMTDNGSSMLATETTEGLARLSVLHETMFVQHRPGERLWIYLAEPTQCDVRLEQSSERRSRPRCKELSI